MVNADYPGSGTGQPCAYSNLQDAIDAASLGDTINLLAGQTFTPAAGASFHLTNKGAGTSFINFQSTGIASLPAGQRVSPSSVSSMATIVSSSTLGVPAIVLNADAHHWKIQGIYFTTQGTYPSSVGTPFLINNNNDGSITYNHWPHDITIDRCLFSPRETDPLPYRSAEEAMSIDGANITITNNYAYNFMGYEYPSVEQAVTAASNASPVQVTFASGISGASNGKTLVFLTGGTGGWAALNGLKVATIITPTTATLQDYNSSTWALTNIDSTSFGAFAGQTINKLTQNLTTSRDILIQAGPGPYTIDNNYLQAQYTSIFLGGSGSWLDPANITTVTAVTDLTHVTLASAANLHVNDLVAFSNTQDQTISGATAGNPTVLTVPTMTYPTGTSLAPEGCISVSGFTGNWAPLNANWGSGGNGCGNGQALIVDSTHISIAVDSTTFGAVTGSGMKWALTTKGTPHSVSPPWNQWVVGKVTNIAGNDITYTWWGHQPDNTNGNGAGILIANGSIAQFNGLVLHDLTVTHNTLAVNSDWVRLFRDVANTGDNLLSFGKGFWESKQGNNVDIEGNIFNLEGANLSPKSGVGSVSINQANQSGGNPWMSVNNWTIRNNYFRNCGYIPIAQVEEYQTGIASHGVTIDNNLFSLTSLGWMILNGTTDATITHNTVRDTDGGTLSYDWIFFLLGTNTNSVVRDNIAIWPFYGYDEQGTPWVPTVRTHDYLIDLNNVGFTPPIGYGGTADVRVATDAAMGFVNVVAADAGGDYHGYALTAGSIGHNAATDGTDVGVNFAALDAALGGAGNIGSGAGGSMTIGGPVTWH